MGDENLIHTLGDYSRPSHQGYRNTIELPKWNNVVPLRSDTIRLVQNGCSFHGLRSEDLNQHLKDFLKLVNSLNLDGENRERTWKRIFRKGRKTKPKMTKLSTEWKGVKRRSKIKANKSTEKSNSQSQSQPRQSQSQLRETEAENTT
ncbi:hypothetical protein Tco_0614800 [Tanacetum coccineum]